MQNDHTTLKVIDYKKHKIKVSKVHPHVISIIQHLKTAGFEAYIVGGGVRDLLLNQPPKDFDVATNALPKEIKRLFRRCHIIGRRFRLAHVYYGKDLVEVATFRAGHKGAESEQAQTKNGMILRDNVYGTIEEDYIRRDLTINALYYDPIEQTILDFCDGFEDIKHKRLRVIGEPKTRYIEDPVRMLRAMRFASKLGFKLMPETVEPFQAHKHLLRKIPPARLYEEIIKCFQTGYAADTYALLKQYQLFEDLFPELDKTLENNSHAELVELVFKNTDNRIKKHKPIVAYFLFAGILWPALLKEWKFLMKNKTPKLPALDQATKVILHEQSQFTLIPNRVSAPTRDIWMMQHRLEERKPRYIYTLLAQPRFRAAYDLLVLRAQSGEISDEAPKWWTAFQAANKNKQREMIKNLK